MPFTIERYINDDHLTEFKNLFNNVEIIDISSRDYCVSGSYNLYRCWDPKCENFNHSNYYKNIHLNGDYDDMTRLPRNGILFGDYRDNIVRMEGYEQREISDRERKRKKLEDMVFLSKLFFGFLLFSGVIRIWLPTNYTVEIIVINFLVTLFSICSFISSILEYRVKFSKFNIFRENIPNSDWKDGKIYVVKRNVTVNLFDIATSTLYKYPLTQKLIRKSKIDSIVDINTKMPLLALPTIYLTKGCINVYHDKTHFYLQYLNPV